MLLLAGAVLLIVAEFLPLYEIRAVTAVPEGGRARRRAPITATRCCVIGLALIPMAWGAVRGGSRPAAIAAASCWRLIALFVALAIDLPDLNETGLIGRTYDQAEARPQRGLLRRDARRARWRCWARSGRWCFRPRR